MYRTILLLSLLAITMSSCSKNLKYFSKDLYLDYDLDRQDMKRIQFYLSDDIVLTRKASSENSKITNGRIYVKDGSRIEEIVFKRGTPGVVVFEGKDNKIGISFEDADDRFLMFGPNENRGNRYVLLAKDWSRNRGKITYDDKTYSTTSASAYASLLVDLKSARKVSYKSRKAGGRTIQR